mgnify:FL=1
MSFRPVTVAVMVWVSIAVISCARETGTESNSAYLSGTITVADSLDSSRNFAEIELISLIQQGNGETDTLFYAVTDSLGRFSGTAHFEENDIYTVLIRRNQNNFGLLNLVFADEDSIDIRAELPDILQTLEITSAEHEVLTTLERVERSFGRIADYINAGAVSPDSVQMEIEKWSDIYWQIYEENPGKHAARLSGEMSANMLRGWDDSLMVARSNSVLKDYGVLSAGSRNTMIEFYAETEGLSRSLDYIDELQSRISGRQPLMDLKMARIELLYDSSRTELAQHYLDEFKKDYDEDQFASEWAADKAFDLEFLAPGSPFPKLEFELSDGTPFRTEEMNGTPYMVEITRFDNALYQQQYDRTIAIYQIYRNYGLEIITIPVSTSRITMDAFFEERSQFWKVVEPNSFSSDSLVETLNLNRIPTRFLVNSDGTIIGRYIGTEYDDIVRGLQRITTQTE